MSDGILSTVAELKRLRSEIADLEVIAGRLESAIKCHMGDQLVLIDNDGHPVAIWSKPPPFRCLDDNLFKRKMPNLRDEFCFTHEGIRVFTIL